MRTFRLVHNIPSPYRLHLFRHLHSELQKRDIAFQVDFMSHGHRERPAAWRNQPIAFPHKFWNDWGIPLIRSQSHFNPGLIFDLLRTPPDYLMVNGGWNTPTNLFISALCKTQCKFVWLEGNTYTPGILTEPVGWIKRVSLKEYDFVAVPGEEGARYLRLLMKKSKEKLKTVILPNMVDETKFCPRWEISEEERCAIRQSLGLKSGDRIAIWPARLEPVKGILPFLEMVDPEWLEGWVILLVGEGSLKPQIDELIVRRALKQHVKILNYMAYDRMPAIYQTSDLFMLPSMRDPNPLSVVEAMHTGLPVLLSARCGNYPEALKQNHNGWGFNPENQQEMRVAARSAFTATQDTLRRFGKNSIEVANAFWNTKKAIIEFCDSLPQL